MAQYKTYTTMAGKDENEFDPETMIEVYDITSLAERQNIIKTNIVVVIYNYTPWCGPCKQCAPQFAKLCKTYIKNGLCALVKEDVDKHFGDTSPPVRGVPCFHFYINGQFQHDKIVMGAHVPTVEQELQTLLNLLR